ncbi:MAG: hypothetical protein NTX45_24865 [Proteobacteria bacterium]|nr:hypothetical protein [Pseudomonadota bacterium]
MNYSISKINEITSLVDVKKKSQALALLDAIIEPEWEYRYFSFNCNWDHRSSEMMASMRDGSGNEYFLHFSTSGVVGKVLYGKKLEETSLLLASVPSCFSNFKNEAAFSVDKASFYFWKKHEDENWSALPNDLEAYPLLGFLVGDSSYYHQWAENYYEQTIDSMVLEKVFNTLHIDSESLKILNSEITLEELGEDILEILGKPI